MVERGIHMSLSGSVGGEVGIAWAPARAYGPRGNTTSLPLTTQLPAHVGEQGNFLVSCRPLGEEL
jgi:hypothetical protein